MKKTTKKVRVLVTGGAGFIGSQVAQRLIDLGYQVHVLDDLSVGRRAYVPSGAKLHVMSIADKRVVQLIARIKPEYVFHLAAQIDLRFSVENPVRDAETNIHGALRVLEGCRLAKVKKIIFSSSGGAMYGASTKPPFSEREPAMPSSPYGIAKLAFELYLRSSERTHGIKFVALRYANVYGPRQDLRGEAGLIGIFVDRLLKGETPAINGDGEQTRDYVFVDDVVDANIRAMRAGVNGVFNIGTGREVSVNRVVELIRRAAGINVRIGHGPARAGEDRHVALDARLARRAMGWKPKVRLEDGIRRTVEWFRMKKLKV
jgi:UDP-glucose 4-epimerase